MLIRIEALFDLMTTEGKILQLENTPKIAISLHLASMQTVQATGKAISPQREHPALENRNLFQYF
jgi:hypothetical protein